MNGDSTDPKIERDFKELFDAYMRRVHDYILAICKSDYLAQEVTQEVFIIIWRKRDELHHVRHIDQYIFRIARNLAIKLMKRAALEDQLATQLYRGSLKGTDEVLEEINRRGAHDLIMQSVMTLPPQPKRIYLLSRHEHMNFDEIALATGLSRNTVKNHLQKALSIIREHLIKNGYQPLIAAIIVRLLDY